MMNLWDFLENMHPESLVVLENNGEMIMKSKVCDISEDDFCMYRIKAKSIVLNGDGILCIPVVHQDEVNREIEEDRKSDFVNILSEMINDANLSEPIKVQLMSVIQQAKHYSYYRKCWDSFSLQELTQYNKERTEEHDLFIIELNRLAEDVVKTTGRATCWSDLLGTDRNKLGDFAEYIANYADSIKGRISILEAVAWAQEHHNQIMYMSDTAKNHVDFRCQLMEQYGFDENQAQAIIDMRNRTFTVQERERVQEELQMLFCNDRLFS